MAVVLGSLSLASCHNYMRYAGGVIGEDGQACGTGRSGLGTFGPGGENLEMWGESAITQWNGNPQCWYAFGQTHYAGNYRLLLRLFTEDGFCDAFDWQSNAQGTFKVEQTIRVNSACGANNYFMWNQHSVVKNNGPPIIDDTIWTGESLSPGDYFSG